MLEVGDKFAGCTIENIKDSDYGRTWLFVHGNEGIFITVRHSDWFDAISGKHAMESFLDQLAERIHIAIRDNSKKISSLQANNGN